MKEIRIPELARLIRRDERMPVTKQEERIWSEIDELAEEIGKHWPEGVSVVDAVREHRGNPTPDEWVVPKERNNP